MDELQPQNTEFLLYQSEDGQVRIETRLLDETVWLTQEQMSNLFAKSKKTVSEHIQNIFTEGELTPESVVRNFRITAADGKQYNTNFYNLDVVISVGYRVRSLRGTQFRIWATQRLREYIIKGFALDDARLKQGGNSSYFDELLGRIRDIRSSEKVFWRKVLDIYATSIDYDPRSELSQQFFAQIQNKMHWAAHGKTAAEIIVERADAAQPNMGMTHWSGARIQKQEAAVAKNYLAQDELELLNRIVTAYLEFAELQAYSRKPMHMEDWIGQLDTFLSMSGRALLDNACAISHQEALDKARIEYDKFKKQQLAQPTDVEKHFVEAEKKIKKLPKKGDQ